MSTPNRLAWLPKSPLQRRFARTFVLSALIPLAVMASVTIILIRGDVMDSVHRELVQITKEKQSRLEDHLETVAHNSSALAALPPIQGVLDASDERIAESMELASATLTAYQEEHWGLFHHVMLVRPDGEVVLSPAHGDAEHAHVGQNLANIEGFSEALRGPVNTGFFGFEETDHYHQLHMQPVRREGKTIGMLIFELEIGHVEAILAGNAEFESSRVSLVTLEGIEVVRSKKDLRPRITNASFELAATAPGIYDGTFEGVDGNEKVGVFIREPNHPWVLIFEVNKGEALAPAARVARVGLATALFGSVIVLLLALRLAKSYSNPLTKLAETATTIASGDLRCEIEIDGIGEIKDVQTALAGMAYNWNETVTQMRDRSEHLTTAAGQLENSSKQLTAGVTTTREQTAAMSAASEEMSVTMSQVASSSTSVSNHVEQSMETVSEMSRGMDGLLERAEKASDVAHRIAEASQDNDRRIQELGRAAEEVGKVIDLIEDIADQTNLLALNATIEAARAGEAGKGFAVVATEVKDLAAQSSQASREIRSEIEGIRGSTETAVDAVRGITTIIEEVSVIATQIDETVREQTGNAEEVLRHMGESNRLSTALSRNVSESSVASKEIATGTSHVASTAEDTARAAELASTSSESLSSMARELSEMAGKFRSTDRSQD